VSGAGDYAIPPSNPYASSLTFAQELWDYGLRNPWRFSFDRLTHDLYIADVGQASREEIDVAPASSAGGENYGWNITEGTICYIAATCNTAGITPPVLDYDHSQGCAIIGGYVYRGADIPALRGLYFYSDNCGGWVRSFRLQAGQAMDNSDWPDLNTGDAVMSFGEDARGELYVMVASGPIYKIVPQ
jgi:glucose/arabinose dehydrogenase